MRRFVLASICVGLAACLPRLPHVELTTPRQRVESLWDFAPHDASAGVVFHEGAFAKGLALIAELTSHPSARRKKAEPLPEVHLPPLATVDDWKKAGLDPSLDGAAFLYPDRSRGALFVLPVRDLAAFRAAFHAKTRTENGREIDDVIFGYSCAKVVERVVCAREVAEIDAAAAAHSSPVAYGGEHLGPDDTGDVEMYAVPRGKELEDVAKEAADYGKLHGVATRIRLRDDGASIRIHAIGEMFSSLARSFEGKAPDPSAPIAAGAPTAMRVHFDPIAAAKDAKSMEDDEKHDLLEQLTGDAEITTSGRGLLGAYASLDLKDGARVERYVKKKCVDAGGFGTGVREITITDHGCTIVFDGHNMIPPVFLDPIPISAEVTGAKLVIAIGGARAPSQEERTLASVLPESDAAFALSDTEAIVAFTKNPFLGPDVNAGEAFKKLFWFVGDDAADRIDAFDDVAAHVAQAFVASRVEEGGVVVDMGIVTFAHDPPEVRAAFDSALAARAAGDVASYRAKLADVARRFPKSLAAQRAAVTSAPAPYLGAGLMAMSSVGAWLGALDTLMHFKPKPK